MNDSQPADAASPVGDTHSPKAHKTAAAYDPAGGDRRPVKLTRITVDLPMRRRAALNAWCLEAAAQLGVTRVTTQAAVSALIHRLLTDERLARQIIADLGHGATDDH